MRTHLRVADRISEQAANILSINQLAEARFLGYLWVCFSSSESVPSGLEPGLIRTIYVIPAVLTIVRSRFTALIFISVLFRFFPLEKRKW